MLTAAARSATPTSRGRHWIARDKLTLADLAIAAPLMHMAKAQLPLTPFENIHAWFARVQRLDAWAKSNPSTFCPV